MLVQDQSRHVEKVCEILRRHPWALDLSVMGAGKTYSTSYLALKPEFGFKSIVVVAPVSVQPKWDDMRDRFGVPIAFNLSYNTLRASKNKQPKHGLLHRIDSIVEVHGAQVDKVEFSSTKLLEDMVDAGLLLVFDEFQHLKNITAQFAAAQSLIGALCGKSKAVLLSGSPFDKQEHAINLFRTLCVMRLPDVQRYNPRTRKYKWTGADEIVKACSKVDDAKTSRLHSQYCWSPHHLCYKLFQDVFRPAVCSCMLHPKMTTKVVKRNAFYEMRDQETLRALQDGIADLKNVSGWDPNKGTVNFATTSIAARMAGLSLAMLAIEQAKADTMVNVVAQRLKDYPSEKAVICVNYTSTIDHLLSGLSEHQPLLLDGRVDKTHRAGVIEKFQAEGTLHRLLIGNMHVCSTGIDLDCKTGKHPRFCLVSPNYSTLIMHQLGHRFVRLDSKADAILHVVYIEQAHELQVMSALARKGTVMKETSPDQVQAGVCFPGDYPEYHETSSR